MRAIPRQVLTKLLRTTEKNFRNIKDLTQYLQKTPIKLH